MLGKAKLFTVWVVAFFGLFLFSSSAVGALTSWGQDQAYAEAVQAHRKEFGGSSKNFVEVKNFGHRDKKDHRDKSDHRDKKDKKGGFFDGIGGGDGEVTLICSVTPLQAAELDAFFNVKEFQIQIGDDIITIERVAGKHLTEAELRAFLRASDPDLDCEIVGRAHVFFLPLIPPQVSSIVRS
jgi:hypothetical protein